MVTLPNHKGGHKGFGYHDFIAQVSEYYDVLKVGMLVGCSLHI